MNLHYKMLYNSNITFVVIKNNQKITEKMFFFEECVLTVKAIFLYNGKN